MQRERIQVSLVPVDSFLQQNNYPTSSSSNRPGADGFSPHFLRHTTTAAHGL